MDDIRALTEAVRELTAELRDMAVLLRERVAEPSRPRGRRQALGSLGESDTGLPRATWLTPIIEAWEHEMGAGSFPLGQALKPLAQLRKKNTEHEIAKRIGYYCRDAIRRNEVKFMSIPKFAATFKTWAPDAPAWDGEDE
jgi:hypothetical protein